MRGQLAINHCNDLLNALICATTHYISKIFLLPIIKSTKYIIVINEIWKPF